MHDSEKPLIHVSIIGCGDIGSRICSELLNTYKSSAIQLSAYSRNRDSLRKLSLPGEAINTEQLDLDNPCDSFSDKFNRHYVFYLAPPPSNGQTDSRIRNWLASLDKNKLPKRILYISTTGVYGDHQGNRVTENTPINPQADRAKRRLDAEQALHDFSRENKIEFVILRVSGIYGKERLPLKRIKDQLPILSPELAPMTNRIHEDDLVQICITAMFKAKSTEIYNVSDGDKLNMSDYFIKVAQHSNLPVPPIIDWQQAESTLSKGMLSYLKESRFIDNSKMLKDLRIKLAYPSISDFFSLYSNNK